MRHDARVRDLLGHRVRALPALDIQPDVLPVSVFGRGVVARMLTLGYNIQSDALVPISVAPVSTGGVRNREMVFTAKVVGTTTDKLVAHVCIADVEACVDGTRSVPGGQTPPAVLIRSWKVTRWRHARPTVVLLKTGGGVVESR